MLTGLADVKSLDTDPPLIDTPPVDTLRGSSALPVGAGGWGKQSLTRMAASVTSVSIVVYLYSARNYLMACYSLSLLLAGR